MRTFVISHVTSSQNFVISHVTLSDHIIRVDKNLCVGNLSTEVTSVPSSMHIGLVQEEVVRFRFLP